MANEMRLIDVNAWKSYYTARKNSLEVYEPYYDGYEDALDHVDDWMDAQPTVDAVPVVHGRWQRYTDEIFMGYDSRGRIKYRKRYTYECTCCGENKLSKTNYCPNCGAKMDGDGNG